MPQVTVTIAGRAYRMACDEGQEEHLRALGQILDTKIAEIRESFGEIGDMRLTVMAGITLADELFETRRRLRVVEGELGRLRDPDNAGRDGYDPEVTHALSSVAERLERVAADLNQRARVAAVR